MVRSIALKTKVVAEVTVAIRHDGDGSMVILTTPCGDGVCFGNDLTPRQARDLARALFDVADKADPAGKADL